MSLHFKYIFILLISSVMLASCGASGNDPGTEYAPNMYHAVPYEPLKQIKSTDWGVWSSSRVDERGEFFNSNPYNKDSMNMRVPPANTVRRNRFGILPYRIAKDSLEYAGITVKNPLDSTEAVLKEGEALYARFCYHCHGANGKGDGPVGKIYKGVPAYSVKRSDGYIFHIITHGRGRMLPHGSQIDIEDRWKIVEYVQKLENQ
jgi:mono/diheme cytochrome c family protein